MRQTISNLPNEPKKPRVQNIYQPPLSPDPVEQGSSAAIKETIKEEEKAQDKFNILLDTATNEIYRTKSIFPFDFFPDQIVIDLNKVSIIKKEFFFSERIHSIFIQDITDVFIETAPFFATLNIIDSGFIDNVIKIRYLKKGDALKARRIIQGLVIAKKQGIDLTQLDTNQLTSKLETIGSTLT